MNFGLRCIAVAVSVLLHAVSGIFLPPTTLPLPQTGAPDFTHAADVNDSPSDLFRRSDGGYSTHTVTTDDASSDDTLETPSSSREAHPKDYFGDRAASLLASQARARAARHPSFTPPSSLWPLKEYPSPKPSQLGEAHGSAASASWLDIPDDMLCDSPPSIGPAPQGMEMFVQGSSNGAEPLRRHHSFRLLSFHSKSRRAPKPGLARHKSAPPRLRQARTPPRTALVAYDHHLHHHRHSSVSEQVWRLVTTAPGHKDKDRLKLAASAVGPRARTNPYEAPYFFPSPVSPEASGYARRAQLGRRPAADAPVAGPPSPVRGEGGAVPPEAPARARPLAPAAADTTTPAPSYKLRGSTKPEPVVAPAPPPPPQPQLQDESGAGPGSRPLNVTDALSYLDAVKVQFHDKPDVYNHFLDIMKTLRASCGLGWVLVLRRRGRGRAALWALGAPGRPYAVLGTSSASGRIDTPGVIERVSMLFHGNPYLIEGFNTFLPPGYHINASADPRDPNLITVTTPLGTMTSKITGAAGGSYFTSPHPHPPPGSRPATPLARLHPPPPFSPPPQVLTTAAASVLGNMGNKTPAERAPPAEFDHAIQYLNKIKTRYPDDQNTTYKQFLEVLQTYRKEQQSSLKDPAAYQHREQRMMHDVYIQVQALFKNEEDLLAEFKDFLPEIAGAAAPPSSLVGIRPYPPDAPGASGPSGSGSGVWPQDTASAPPAPKSTQAAPRRRKREPPKEPQPPRRRRRRCGLRAEGADMRVQDRKRQRVAKPAAGKAHVQSPTFSSYQAPPSPLPGPAHAYGGAPAAPTTTGASSAPAAPALSSPQDELAFFERAKRALEARDAYDDFLKLLNMYTRDVVDVKTLVVRAERFLADDALLAQFKRLVGWDDRAGNHPHGPHDAALPRPVDDAQSPSYRRLPDSEVRLATSGRDQLARTVLNDEWVSHPTWASEEAGFVAHKKNSFEEVIHRCEDERHEYQITLEGLARTLALLEPLAARLRELAPDERAALRLRADLGGPSAALYLRTLRKVYGRDAGAEVLQALQDAPGVALPVVLARLRQKDGEWRRAQREWAHTWRAVDAKNWYKSLDPTGINFKQNDKKAITTKAFVAELDAAPRAQGLVLPLHAPGVLADVLRLVVAFLDHSQAAYGPAERRAVERFLRAFVPALGLLPPAAHGGGRRRRRRLGRRTGAWRGVHAGDLRRKLVRAAAEAEVPTEAPKGKGRAVPRDVWIRESVGEEGAALRDAPAGTRPFFCNTTFYTLLRLIQLLHARLASCREEVARHARAGYRGLLANPVAVELGLDDAQGPAGVLGQVFRGGGGEEALYGHMLEACEKLFAGEMDQAAFEEHMRWFFGTKADWIGRQAFLLYTVDKVVASLIKQVQTIVSDGKCQELWHFLRRQRCDGAASSTRQDIMRYRRAAEHHVGADDNLYRVEWDGDARMLAIRLVGAGDASVGDGGSAVARWREYVDSYVLESGTEWATTAAAAAAASGRGRQGRHLTSSSSDDGSAAMRSEGGLGVRVSLGTYRLFFEAGSEWAVWRTRGAGSESAAGLARRGQQREEERRRRLAGMLTYF
ncbi:hypothetical protein BC834DRAFT_840132 [Gloeopeniophorella convolvens]|nr:hypothetical protein BC834DRAFT_840132 [Gloeopeniophorella convolvens]